MNSDHEHERDAQHPPRQRRARGPSTQRPHLRQVGLDRDLQTGTEHGRQTTIFSARTIETLAAAAAASSARSALLKARTGSCARRAEGALRNNSRPRHATIPRAAYPSATRPKSPNRSVAGGGTADVERAASLSANDTKLRDQFPSRSGPARLAQRVGNAPGIGRRIQTGSHESDHLRRPRSSWIDLRRVYHI